MPVEQDEQGKYICGKCGKPARVVYLDKPNKRWVCEDCHLSKDTEKTEEEE